MSSRDEILVDSNIVINAARPEFAGIREYLEANAPSASTISYIEAMGFHQLGVAEQAALDGIFSNIRLLPIDDHIVDAAVRLRRQRKISLGDSIVAATALVHRLTLVTRNVADFRSIEGLDTINPLESSR